MPGYVKSAKNKRRGSFIRRSRRTPGKGATAEFRPFVWDTVVPICRSGGDCDRKAEKMAETFRKEVMPTLKLGRKRCERCGKVTGGIKLCSSCKVLR